MFSRTRIISLLVTALCFGCNPFAPGLDEEGLTDQQVLGDRTTLDGLFDYFEGAYEIRDTSLYSQLFAPDFMFTYWDFDHAAEIKWDKGQELLIAYNMFRSVQQITLDWNFYVEREENDTLASVSRSFNLTIVERENQVYSGTGRARLKLRREDVSSPWKIYEWFDDSDF